MNPEQPLKPRPKGSRKSSLQQRQESGPEFESSKIRHGYFKSFDDTRLFYTVEGTGKPLVFCYGLVCSSLHWTYQIDYFRKNYQTIWFDYRGHQNSDIPKDRSTLSLYGIAKDVKALFTELGLKEAVVLGHSMGVNVVLEFCRQFPQNVKAMVLANGTAKRPLETIFHNNFAQGAYKILRKINELSPGLVKYFWKHQKDNPISKTLVSMGGFNPHLTSPEDIELYVKQVCEMDPGVFIDLIGKYDEYDATSWLHTLKCPTLILGGEQDNITPLEQQKLMHQLITGSRFETIKHGSHCPQMDLPELVSLKIEQFLNQLQY